MDAARLGSDFRDTDDPLAQTAQCPLRPTDHHISAKRGRLTMGDRCHETGCGLNRDRAGHRSQIGLDKKFWFFFAIQLVSERLKALPSCFGASGFWALGRFPVAQSIAKSLSEKGSDPLEASRFHRVFGHAGEGQTPFRMGSKTWENAASSATHRIERTALVDSVASADTHGTMPRRDVLRLGGLYGLGLSLPLVLQQKSLNAGQKVGGNFGRAKQVIVIYLHGGHPQQETFDPKPNGPEEVRGEFGAIATRIPGVHFSELLPRTAQIADRLAIVRSMSHANSNHVTASLPALTGHVHPPGTPQRDFPPTPEDFPPFGAVVNKALPGDAELPSWVRIGPLMRRSNGTVLHGQLPGFLGAAYGSFDVDQDLLADDLRIQAVQQAAGLTELRVQHRRGLLEQFDQNRRLVDRSPIVRDYREHYQNAVEMLTSAKTRHAFDLAAEPRHLRESYGTTEFGQRCLLARRLAEAGVPLINVSYCQTPKGSWDTHNNHFNQMRDSLAPTFDIAFSALINDLEQRGMLDETLVFVNAEFGRTPKINAKAGRDHWPFVYSLALAGAGVGRGVVYGASDQAAAYPTDRPHDPKDMAATIYHLLGVDPELMLHDRTGRPYHVCIGKPIQGILA